MNRPGRVAARDRGFALLIVLWTMILLSLLVTRITATGRNETQIAANLRTNAASEASADGAVFQAIFHLLDSSDQRWVADGSTRTLRLPRATAAIRIDDEASKVNPNIASPELLQALLRELGTSPATAASLATAIVDWRTARGAGQKVGATLQAYQAAGRDVGPPGTRFQTIDELGSVLGMTPDLLAALRSHLTVSSESDPGPDSPDRIVARAVAEAGGTGDDAAADDPDDTLVASITASVVQADGGRFARYAVVRISPAAKTRPYRILQWGTPNDA